MAKGKDTKIPDLQTPWDGYVGGRVEELIKEYLNAHELRYGYVAVEDNPATGKSKVRFFADASTYAEWNALPPELKEESALVVGIFECLYKQATVEEYLLTAQIIEQPVATIIKGSKATVKFAYNSLWQGDKTDPDTKDGYAVVTANGTEVARMAVQSKFGADYAEYELEFGSKLTSETNTIEITIGNSWGKSRTFQLGTLQVITLEVGYGDNYDDTIIREGNWELPIKATGVTAMVHVLIDGNEVASQSITNSSYNFRIDPNDQYTAGKHTISVYGTSEEYGLTSDTITSSYIKKGVSAIAIGKGATTNATMYDTVTLPYYFYLVSGQEGNKVNVSVELKAIDDTLIQTLPTQSVTVRVGGASGAQSVSVPLMNNAFRGKQAKVVLTVATRSVEHIINVADAGVILEAAAECKVYFNMAEHSNNDKDVVDNHISAYYQGAETAYLERDFELSDKSGFVNSGFVVPVNKRLSVKKWQPFAVDFGVNNPEQTERKGRTIELEFATGTSADIDAVVVDCMDTKCGFRIYPNRIVTKSEQGGEVTTYFSDSRRIKFTFEIDSTTTRCVADTGNKDVEPTVEYRNIARMYVNGVIVRIFDYTTSTWNQASVKDIVFGSDQCDITIYSIRGYEKPLSVREVLGNYSFDTPLLEDKLAIAKRNNILASDGSVDYGQVREVLSGTPVIGWFVEQLPANKKDEKPIKSTDFINPQWDRISLSCAPFHAGEHVINGDGTSSNNYPLPYKNWAEKFSNGLTLQLVGKEQNVKTYSITYGIEDGEKEFVHKVNFASSEGIFNILAMNLYDQVTKGINADVLSKQQKSDITFRKSLSGFPEIGFRTYTDGTRVITKFLSIYNFINNKYSGSMFGMSGDWKTAQLWEVDENVNFFQSEFTLNEEKDGELVQSTGVRSSNTWYYSRNPKKRKGADVSLGVAETIADIPQANKEIEVLRRFHNFIYTCNPNVAKRYYTLNGNYKPLPEPVTYGTTTFTHDTPAYRLQKFIAEYQDYLVADDAIFYFIFCTFIIGMDSMDKNMSIFFDDVQYDENDNLINKPKARFMLRDTDTQMMFNNSGVLQYKYWHEWNDVYNATTGETGVILGETFSQSEGWQIKPSIEGGEEVFNGRLSGLWDLVVLAFPERIKTLYTQMRGAGLSYSNMMNMYRGYWSQWCEALYNTDAMGYANTGYFHMAYGDKLELANYFLQYRSRYMSSKYGASEGAKMVVRLYGSIEGGIAVKEFAPIYAGFGWGNDTPTPVRVLDTEAVAYLPAPVDATFSNATGNLYDADFVTELGTYYEDIETGEKVLRGLEGLGNCYIDNNSLGACKRLQQFVMAYTQDKPNTRQTSANNLDFGALKMLKELTATYLVNYTNGVNITSEQIEKINLVGTPAISVTIPSTPALKEVHLPHTLQTLTLVDTPNITSFSIAGTDNLTSVKLINCGNVDSLNIIVNSPNLTSIHCEGINWRNVSASMLVALAEKGATLTGKISLKDDLSMVQKQILISHFGNIDNTDNGLYVTYNKYPTTVITIIGAKDVYELGKQYTFMVSATPDKANNIDHTEWEMDANEFAVIDKYTGVVTRNNKECTEETPQSATIYATAFAKNNDGTEYTLSANFEIRFYERKAKVGDFVYYDGTYSASEDYDGSKTVIGVCYYVKGNDRRMVAIEQIGGSSAYGGGYGYGLSSSKAWAKALALVGDDSDYIPYKIPMLKHSNNLYFNERLGNLINLYTPIEADFFKEGKIDLRYEENPEFYPLLSKGFAHEDYTNLDNWTEPAGADRIEDTRVAKFIEYLPDDLRNQTSLPEGLVDTIRVIMHRDRILKNPAIIDDSGNMLPYPQESDTMTEMQKLKVIEQYVKNLSLGGTVIGSSLFLMYYPTVSFAYSFEPTIKTGEVLNEKFKKHHWWLPASGEAHRIDAYNRWGKNNGINGFESAKSIGYFSKAGYLCSVDVYLNTTYGTDVFIVTNTSVQITLDKWYNNGTHPVCSF